MRRATRAPPWTCALRVLRTWAAPSPLKRAADPPLCSGYRGSCLESKQRVIRSAKSPPATWQGAISTSRLLLLATPGTTYAPAQPLAAKRRGGCACGRWAAAGEGAPVGASPPWQWVISTFRFLLFATPGTTYAPAQPLGTECRGGSACGC